MSNNKNDVKVDICILTEIKVIHSKPYIYVLKKKKRKIKYRCWYC